MEQGIDYEKNATGWLIAIYIFALLGGFLGIFFGTMIYRNKVELPDGQKVYKYKETHRKAALAGAILASISMVVWGVVI